MVTTAVLSLGVLVVAGLLIDSHRRTWREVVATGAEGRELRFARGQFRRRMYASSLMAAVGGLVGVGPIVPRRPLWMAAYLLLLTMASLWIMSLGVFDAWATRQHFQRRRLHQFARHAAELHRLRTEARPPGDASAPPSPSED